MKLGWPWLRELLFNVWFEAGGANAESVFRTVVRSGGASYPFEVIIVVLIGYYRSRILGCRAGDEVPLNRIQRVQQLSRLT